MNHNARYPLVALHAFPLHSAMWNPQRELLAGTIDLITPDLPGFGRRSPIAEFTMATVAADILRQLDEQGVQRCVVCGLSMGGYIAFECWRQFPDRIVGMILCDTRATADDPNAVAVRRTSAQAILDGGYESYCQGMIPRLLSEHTIRENPEVVHQVEAMMRENSPEAAAAGLLGMAVRQDSTQLLETITVPVALIFGEHDVITPVRDGEAMLEYLPNATLHVLPHAGHMSNLEDPEGFAGVIKRFLEDR